MAEQEGIKSITLEDPPPRRVGKYDWAAIAEQVKSQAGKWCRVFEDDKHSLTISAKTSVKSLRKDLGFSFRTSNTHHVGNVRYCSFYIKYDPKKDTSKTERSE